MGDGYESDAVTERRDEHFAERMLFRGRPLGHSYDRHMYVGDTRASWSRMGQLGVPMPGLHRQSQPLEPGQYREDADDPDRLLGDVPTQPDHPRRMGKHRLYLTAEAAGAHHMTTAQGVPLADYTHQQLAGANIMYGLQNSQASIADNRRMRRVQRDNQVRHDLHKYARAAQATRERPREGHGVFPAKRSRHAQDVMARHDAMRRHLVG